MRSSTSGRLRIAVVGSGISGLSAAWLAQTAADVTLFEADGRLGGHAATVDVETARGPVAVDMGFIVYNEAAYPNLVALFGHLGIATEATDMSLAISLDDGRLEYGGGRLSQLFAQKRNMARPRFWSMVRDVVRFYREAPRHCRMLEAGSEDLSLGDYLDRYRYGAAFRDDHLLPMAAAIWSVARNEVLDFPVVSFIRFHENHGLLKLAGRPLWRTVSGGSRTYVQRLAAEIGDIRVAAPVRGVAREGGGVRVTTGDGASDTFDHVVLATHADTALGLIESPTAREARLLGSFRYNRNEAVLHSDPGLMPKRRRAWSSWNYLGCAEGAGLETLTVTYWMNLLQNLDSDRDLFVTLNPGREPRADSVHEVRTFEHPVMDRGAVAAQRELWALQGEAGVWFAGSHFGAGFHEDGLQAGLAVAEQITGAQRPWTVANESGRIPLDDRLAVAADGRLEVVA